LTGKLLNGRRDIFHFVVIVITPVSRQSMAGAMERALAILAGLRSKPTICYAGS
jgi:hypothetical protein